jgi:predicted Fe-S protein YdhL (DUF1289 family)
MHPIATPCIDICKLDPHSRLCTGCGRTGDEIARWSEITETERLALMAEARARLAGHEPVETATGCA